MFLLSPLLSAVTINDTLIQTSLGNLTVNITTPSIYLTELLVNESYIAFYGFKLDINANETLSYNLTDTNVNRSRAELPYINSSTSLLKTIMSNFTNNISGSAVFTSNEDCSNIVNIYYQSANGFTKTYSNDFTSWITGYDYVCNLGVIQLNFQNLATGTNTFTFNKEFSDSELSPYCRTLSEAFTTFATFFAVIILAIIFAFVYLAIYRRDMIPAMVLAGVITLTLAGTILIMGVILIGKMC